MPIVEIGKNIWRGKTDQGPERANRNKENGEGIMALQLRATGSSQNLSKRHPTDTALSLTYCRKNHMVRKCKDVVAAYFKVLCNYFV
jgi:hypothetical protein